MAKSKKLLLGENARKIQPKLRMIANGSTRVNARRAERSGQIAVKETAPILEDIVPPPPNEVAPVKKSQVARSAAKGDLYEISEEILAHVFIETADVADPEASSLPEVTKTRANLSSATLPLSELSEIADKPQVAYIELGETLAAPTPIVSATHVGEPQSAYRRLVSSIPKRSGAGVIIGIIDVQGFDFAHPDFLDKEGKHTRFIRIWDQGGDARPSPEGFDYGAEFLQEHLNTALQADIGAPPQDIEQQSQMAPGSHGTHVASIAAGNLGVCPDADIAAVLIALPDVTTDDGRLSYADRRTSFYDSTCIAHAVEYLINVAAKEGKPIVINISLGTNGHAHDASSAVSRWIDNACAVPGRAVCVAAGNAGQEVGLFDGDIGYVMGRIHTSGQIPARGLNRDIEWMVVGNGVADISENELEIWYSPQDRFNVWVKPPNMAWIGPVKPREFIENQQLRDGSFVSIYNELYHPANGANCISVYLSPFFGEEELIGVAAGRWVVRLSGLEVRDGRYHGWIERDDPRRIGRDGPREFWGFPSFFTARSNVDNSSVSSLACGQRIISVGNLDELAEQIHITSSQGPTREGRFKPDVAAPGTDIVAANGFAGRDDLWVAMTGTSMASPHVTGVVGLMLSIEPKLTAAQIEGIIQRTAQPLPNADFTWANDAGFGRIDAQACLDEAAHINRRDDKTP